MKHMLFLYSQPPCAINTLQVEEKFVDASDLN